MKIQILIFLSVLAAQLSAVGFAAVVVHKSTVKDQASVAVTAYGNNLALIKDVRKVRLLPGRGELRFMDVASRIKPVTVHVRSLTDGIDFSVLEQNYEYDLMNDTKLLDKYVGKEIKIITWNQFQDRKEEVAAILLSNNQGQIYRIGNEIYLGHPGYKVLPRLPENLIARPTLAWQYQSGRGGTVELEVSYLTEGIGWKADYIVVLAEDDRSLDLSGWVSLDNQSGAVYKNAVLKLVAGDVHTVEEPTIRFQRKYAFKADMKPAQGFRENKFFEYHLYDLERKTTVKDKQIKQISLLEANGVKGETELVTESRQGYVWNNRSTKKRQPVNVYLKFKNSQNNRLGMPLPKGIMRLYKKDHQGDLQFVGEDKIKHTPRDEEIKLMVGAAFDVVAERVQTDFKKITSRINEIAFEISLRNRKEKAVNIGVVEPVNGDWRVLKHSHPYRKIEAYKIRFDVTIQPGREVKISYRYQVER